MLGSQILRVVIMLEMLESLFREFMIIEKVKAIENHIFRGIMITGEAKAKENHTLRGIMISKGFFGSLDPLIFKNYPQLFLIVLHRSQRKHLLRLGHLQ